MGRGKEEYNLLVLNHHENMPWAKKEDLFHLCEAHGTQPRSNSIEKNDVKLCNY